MTKVTTILLTRPQAESEKLAKALTTQFPNLRCIISPLLEIVPIESTVDLTSADALVFTSANAVRIFGERSTDRKLPAFCVGQKTAAAARDIGLVVTAADGDVSDLARLISESGLTGTLLHVRGRHSAADLAALLEKTGLSVQSCILYDQVPQPLNADAIEALQTHVVDAVTIYSPRTAGAFLDSIRRLKPVSLTVLCISPAACEPLEELPNVNFRIAARPTGRHMVSLIEDFLAESRR